MKKVCMFLLIFVLMATACVPGGKTVPTMALPTETSVPTKTPIPTKTPVPPTPTIAPPDLLYKYLNNPRITYLDAENRGPSGGFYPAKKVDGYIELTGKDWNGFAFDRKFTEKQGMMINFRLTLDSLMAQILKCYLIKGNSIPIHTNVLVRISIERMCRQIDGMENN